MKKYLKRIEKIYFKAFVKIRGNEGFGMNELLGIAAALILAAFIIIPGLRVFTDNVMDKLTSWWNVTVVSSIFPTT